MNIEDLDIKYESIKVKKTIIHLFSNGWTKEIEIEGNINSNQLKYSFYKSSKEYDMIMFHEDFEINFIGVYSGLIKHMYFHHE